MLREQLIPSYHLYQQPSKLNDSEYQLLASPSPAHSCHRLARGSLSCVANLCNVAKSDLLTYLSSVCALCRAWPKSLYLLICLKIGTDHPQQKYFENIKYLLSSPFSVGILGGKPKRALYFVGFQGDSLILLDPHYVQPGYEKVDTQEQTGEFFRPQVTRIKISQIDTRLAFGFSLPDYGYFVQFVEYLLSGRR